MYHGLVTTKEKIENRRTRGLIRRIKTYNEWLMNHEGYDTTIFPIGDGVAVSKREGDQGMKKPELLVTPRAVADIEPLAKAGADAVMIGEQRFGLRLAGEFSREDVKQTVKIAHENGVKVYVAMNAMFHNDKVEELTDYVSF